jgi:NADH:ubiquinone oxidoreductase subunit 2 (subunit N)
MPVPFQAIVYPLVGALAILATARLLPGWIRRLLAAAAALASLTCIWSLRSGGFGRVEFFWEPLNLFRMSPTLWADSLSLLAGLALAGASTAIALGIRGDGPKRATWQSAMLAALAGCLIVATAANLPTLALGSALIDLVLIALVLLGADRAQESALTSLAAGIPGMAATLLLLFSAMRMDAQTGHTSLLARNLPEDILALVGVAGALRLLVFPLHVRGWQSPERAAFLLLPMGAGIYLLARVQALVPVLGGLPWMSTVGGAALLAGALLTWSSSRSMGFPRFWPGVLAYQAGYALAFLILVEGTAPWPLLALTLPLGALAILWDDSLGTESVAKPRWQAWLGQRIQPWQAKAQTYLSTRLPVLERLRSSWSGRHIAMLLSIPILASLAGAPLTIGLRARWPFYATLLNEGNSLLVLVLVADTLVAAALWTRVGIILKGDDKQRPRPGALLAMVTLVVPIIILGIAPGKAGDAIGLAPAVLPNVSVWGLGLVFALPWLLGAWLARVGVHLERYLDPVWRIVNLEWFFRGLARVGQRLVDAVHWLGRVGEGEGWWGWALIILALGVIFVTAQ